MIKLRGISLHRGVKVLCENANLEIFAGQKVAIIGPNGCGKSSMFAMFNGDLSPDIGEFSITKHWKTVSISQYIDNTDRTTLDYVIDGDIELRAVEQALIKAEQSNNGNEIANLHTKLNELGAYDVRARAATILAGLSFSESDLRRKVADFSGGWQMRLNLARALLCPSDLLLLDEPTNHLDLDAVLWLQDYLQNYKGTLLLISHDQAFIDACANIIVSFENKALFSYTGNFSSFQKQRAERLLLVQKQYEKQEQKKAHLNDFIRRFKAKASKAKQAQSRVKQLEKMEDLLPIHQASGFSFEFRQPDKLPNPLVHMEEIKIGYGKTVILSDVQFNLVPGSRIGLLGRNGAGKSTFIKLLAEELKPLDGIYTTSSGLQIGYFAQHQVSALNLQNSAFDHLLTLDRSLSDQQIRDYLGGFGFHGEEALKKVEPMSGGEKARLVLALVVYTKPNLLLLDEPTNHLDMQMREAIAYALQSFEGAMIIVSHDRFLLEAVCDDFYLVDAGIVAAFKGDLNDYQKWMLASKKQLASEQSGQTNNSPDTSKQSLDKKAKKRLEAEFRQSTKSFRDTIARSEKKMAQLNTALQRIEEDMLDTSLYEETNKARLTAIINEQAEAKSELEELEMAWLDSQESLEAAQQQFDDDLTKAS